MVKKLKKAQEKFELLFPAYPTDEGYEDVVINWVAVKIPTDRPVRIICAGVFDMFHYGHSRLFAQVKSMFPNVFLLAGVHNDETTHKNKGITVMNEKERYESTRHCKYVDEVIENVPWVMGMDFITKYKIDYIAHDATPYPSATTLDTYGFAKEIGKFIPTIRAKKVSTTQILTGIFRKYDTLITRQILRGIPYKDLNISFFRGEKLRFKSLMNKEKARLKTFIKCCSGMGKRLYWHYFQKKAKSL